MASHTKQPSTEQLVRRKLNENSRKTQTDQRRVHLLQIRKSEDVTALSRGISWDPHHNNTLLDLFFYDITNVPFEVMSDDVTIPHQLSPPFQER